MKSTNMIVIICLGAIMITGCEGDAAMDSTPLSEIRFVNKLMDDVLVTVKIDDHLFEDKSLPSMSAETTFLLPSGNHEFAFYNSSNELLLDTTFTVTGLVQSVDLFRVDAASPLVFLNDQILGLDTVTAPKPGHFKIRIANFTKDSIDVIFWLGDRNFQKFRFDTIHNVTKDFSAFHEVYIPTEANGEPLPEQPLGPGFEVYDRFYEMNYGDFLYFDMSTIQPISPGKIYVAYILGGAEYGSYEMKELYKK